MPKTPTKRTYDDLDVAMVASYDTNRIATAA
jgi:hypothetical protein